MNKKKFEIGQAVVMQISDKFIVGKVTQIIPHKKSYIYDVMGEDGKLYSDVQVNSHIKHTILVAKTITYYKAMKMDVNKIPTKHATTQMSPYKIEVFDEDFSQLHTPKSEYDSDDE